MKDLLVSVAMTSPQHLFEMYMRQLDEAGIDRHVELVVPHPNVNCGGTFEYKLDLLRRLAVQFSNYEKLVFTCAWDVLFFGKKTDVLEKIPDQGVILAAERNCYPDPSIGDRFKGNTPWRYYNGGLMAGTPQSIVEWANAIERHPLYNPSAVDQKSVNLILMEGSPLAPIDDHTELFYCMAGELGELDFVRGLPRNTLCNTQPNFLHFNGRHDPTDALAKLKRSLEETC